MNNLSAELETKNLENKLNVLCSGLGDLFNELLNSAGREMAAAAKSRAAFQNRTGRLYNSINFIMDKKNMTGALTTRKAINKSNVWYGNVVESGSNVQAKKSGYLVFKIDGEWKKVKAISARPRPFMKDVFYEYFGDDGKGYQALADALLEKINREIE